VVLSDVKTNADLLTRLEQAARRKQTAAEIDRQRVSFIKSAIKDGENVTETTIRRVLAKQDGSENP